MKNPRPSSDKKRGPARLKGENARAVSTSVRFPWDEYLRIRKSADRARLSISDYLRSLVPEATMNMRLRSGPRVWPQR